MAGGSRQLEELKLSETSSCAMGGSDDLNSVIAPASEGGRATMSSSLVAQGGSTMETEKSGECSGSMKSVEEQIEESRAHWSVLAEPASIAEEQESDYVTAAAVPAGESDDATESKLPFMTALEEQIERSKAHWSTLADQSGSVEGEEVAEVSNVEEFLALQSHPSWGTFFATFGYELDGARYRRLGELELGEKFAEGGQAELYNAHVTWWYPEANERDLREGTEYVVKVFKKGTLLKHLQSQLPQGLLRFHVESMENATSTLEDFPRYFCKVHCLILLEDGRFAFLMEKDHFDLRNLIELQMGSTSGKESGPFSKEEAEIIMYDVALGVNWLHSRAIIHRDLKASNVLVREYKSGWPMRICIVADYECSVGVVGTGFFRAPEILQACKDKMASKKPEVFSRATDAYSFEMICYEILTGKLPFEDHPLSVSLLTDLVINQHLRPEVPQYVENWACELLRMCWQSDSLARPSFGEILDLLSNNSTEVKRREDDRIQKYGQNYRNWSYKGEEVAEVSNIEEFLALQSHPSWGCFFQTFGYEFDDSEYTKMGELELGEKFAKGVQAELYNAHVTWWKPESNERDVRDGREYVVKVFKKGTLLKHLKSQLSQGLLQLHAENMENFRSPLPQMFPRYFCTVHCGILLEDGRFAFLMEKDHFDLRNLIELQMGSTSGKDSGPFSKEEVELIIYDVALGVNWLHSHGIIHRDLKASNILVQEFRETWPKWICIVADYECSVGVVGTGFFRAPEILQACKDKMASKKPEVFSIAADAYSFGMTCYEILTGKLPFEDHPLSVSILTNLVINQHLRPKVPEYVEDWACELLEMCWQSNHIARPSFGEILDLLIANSAVVKRREDSYILKYGQNYRNLRYKHIPNS